MSDANLITGSTRTPTQDHIGWQQFVEKEKRAWRNHVSVKGIPGSTAFPGFKDVSKLYPGPLNYFNSSEPKHDNRNIIYDGIFHQDFGYDPKRPRSDRNANISLDIAGQERKRVVHVSANSAYGRRWADLEKLQPKTLMTNYGHCCVVDKELYRACNLGIPLKVDDAEQIIQP